jgi:hypothetical protein
MCTGGGDNVMRICSREDQRRFAHCYAFLRVAKRGARW